MARDGKQMAGVAIVVCLLGAGPLQAGVYNMAESSEAPAGPIAGAGGVAVVPFKHFQRDLLIDLLSTGVPGPGARRQDFLKRRDDLQSKARSGSLSVPERVNLSAYLIRLGQYEEAAEVLNPIAGGEQANFMVFANLATANQLAGRLERAISCLHQVKDVWPTRWPGLSAEQLAWYRQAESYHLKLLRLRRLREAIQGAEHLDDLFGPVDAPVRFVGDSGHYEAGHLAAVQRQKLPADALALVEQLLIWLPQDTRLYWLLGEVLNAQGEVPQAAAVLEDCVGNRGWNAPELREHRRILKAFKPPADEPELADVAAQAEQHGDQPKQPAEQGGWLPERRQLWLVGGLAGVMIMVLGLLQVREMRRRRLRLPAGERRRSSP